jgi:hypothetical protein
MKSIIENLQSFGLTNPETLQTRISGWGANEFDKFFESHFKSLQGQHFVTPSPLGNIDVYPDSACGQLPIPLVKQLALYANRVYLHDPILTAHESYSSLNFNAGLILKHKDPLERLGHWKEGFLRIIRQLNELLPLVEVGVVHLSPSQLLRTRRDPRGLYADNLYGLDGQFGSNESSELTYPPAIVDYVNKRLHVYNCSISSNGQVEIFFKDELRPGRSIAIMFDDGLLPSYFLLGNLEPKEQRDGFLRVKMEYSPSDPQPVDEKIFEHWYIGEARKVVRNRIDQLTTDIEMAARAGARLLTSIPSNAHLLGLSTDPDKGDNLLAACLEFELPYFEHVRTSDIARARQNESAFHEFRESLQAAVKGINTDNPATIQAQLDDINRDIIHGNLLKIDNRMRSLKRDVLVDVAITAGTFVSTFIASGGTLAGVAASSYAMLKYAQHKHTSDDITDMPGYFFWDVTKKIRR